ncbi:MAG: hypothetical protein ACI90V_007033 [Bacillariaceae sp.]|jgi:hypothetical protein
MGDDDDKVAKVTMGNDDDKAVDNNIVIIIDDYCDESKCVSSYAVPSLTTENGTFYQFICYAEGNEMRPFACSEGYEGHVVENEPTIPSPLDGETLFYYTCCPPKSEDNSTDDVNSRTTSSSSQHHERHCGDPIFFEENNTNLLDSNSNNENNICYGKGEPRNTTKAVGHTESYTCCNSSLPSNNVAQVLYDDEYRYNNSSETTNDDFSFNFLDEIDCVPYLCNDHDYDCLSTNKYGRMEIMQCYDEIYNNSFIYPRSVAKYKQVVRFECCKIGTYTQLLPMETTTFKLTFWIQLVVSLIALISSLILMISLLLPLLLKKSKRYNNNRAAPCLTTSHPTTSQPQRIPRQTSQQTIKRKYSSYNLYLVFLVFPDVLFNAFIAWRCISDLSGHAFNAEWALAAWIYGETQQPSIMFIFYGCTTANLGMNTLIAFEVFKLLKNSNQRIRQSPPTIKRVVLQATGVYLYSIVLTIIIFGLLVWVPKFIRSDTKQNRYSELANTVGGPIVLALSAGIPFMVLIYICGVVWRRRLVRKSDRHLRILAIFFLRIVFVFIVIWCPAYILWGIDKFNNSAVSYGPIFAVSMLLISIQSILSNALAIMKPDVKEAVLDLITFSVCCNSNSNSNSNSNNNSNSKQEGNIIDRISPFIASLFTNAITTTNTPPPPETTFDSQQQRKVYGTSDDEAGDSSIQSCTNDEERLEQQQEQGEDTIIAV